jgi:hypothetical protein
MEKEFYNIFTNNSYVPITTSRPPNIKIEEINPHLNQRNIVTEVDIFDQQLYEKCLKLKNIKTPIDKEIRTTTFKYTLNQNLYFEKNYELKFDNLSGIKPIYSKPSLGNILRSKYKLKLAKIYKTEKLSASKDIEVFDDNYKNVNKIKYKKRTSSTISDNGVIYEQNKKKIDDAVLKMTKKNSFYPTHSVMTSEISKNRVSVNLKDLNSELTKKPQDSIYNSNFSSMKNLKSKSSRPAFVNELFKKYDYENLEPWKKVQNRTKDKSLCLSVIKDIYNKITSIFD